MRSIGSRLFDELLMGGSKIFQRRTSMYMTKNKITTFAETTKYEIDKITFIVQPVFKEQSAETLGSVLLRLMTANN